MIRRGKWKLHQYFETGAIELYDLASDIGETTNLATQEQETTTRLLKELAEWQKQINAPIPTEKNPSFDPDFEVKAIEKANEKAQAKKAKTSQRKKKASPK